MPKYDKNIFGGAINFCNVQRELKITALNKKRQPKVHIKLKFNNYKKVTNNINQTYA